MAGEQWTSFDLAVQKAAFQSLLPPEIRQETLWPNTNLPLFGFTMGQLNADPKLKDAVGGALATQFLKEVEEKLKKE